jgi:hypothetical protein
MWVLVHTGHSISTFCRANFVLNDRKKDYFNEFGTEKSRTIVFFKNSMAGLDQILATQ